MTTELTKQFYIYIGNQKPKEYNAFQEQFINRQCEILISNESGTCLIKFTDNGEQLNTTLYRLKKV